ncbi:MAG TPA: acyltransferase [Micromonospora sp.]
MTSNTATSSAPTPPAAARRSRLPSVTGFRWWILLMSLFEKFALSSGAECGPYDSGRPVVCNVVEIGMMPVVAVLAGFFVLAGFVLTWNARPGFSKRRFWRRRFAKIYPLFFLSIMVDMVIRWFTDQPIATIPVLILNLLMVQTWIPNVDLFTAVHPVTWTLCCIAFFYLCYPYLYAGLSRLSTRALRFAFAGLIFWPALSLGVMWLIAPSAVADPFHVGWLLYMFPLARVSEFAIGIVAALLLQRGAWKGLRVGPAIAVMVLGYLAGIPVVPFLGPAVPGYSIVLTPLFALLIVSLANADITGAWSPLRRPFMVHLGNTGYAFYLSHIFIAQNLGQVVPWDNSWQILGYMAVTFVLSVLLALALYHWVELPMQNLLGPKSWSTPAHPARPADTPTTGVGTGTGLAGAADTAGGQPAATANGADRDRADAGRDTRVADPV